MAGRWDNRDSDRGNNRNNTAGSIFAFVVVVAAVYFLLNPVVIPGTDTPQIQVRSVTVIQEPSLEKMQTVERLVFTYTNEERQKHNVPTLVWDDRLAAIAREHSCDMAEKNFFDHTNLAGEDHDARAARHGYPLEKDLGNGYYAVGIAENIGTMPIGNVIGIGIVTEQEESVARALVKSWMESPGHRANILEAQYSHLGVGIAYKSEYYATQDFW